MKSVLDPMLTSVEVDLRQATGPNSCPIRQRTEPLWLSGFLAARSDCQCTRMDSAARPALLPLSSVTIRMKRILRTTNHAALQDAADLVRFSCPVLTANLD